MRNYHDPEDFFEVDDLRRQREERQRMTDLAEQRNIAERKRREELEARLAIEGAQRSKASIEREYETLGLVQPPGMLVSLSLLKNIGWKIKEDQFGAELVPPAGLPLPTRTREDYAE